MSILTKPSAIVKGIRYSFTLSKSELLNLSQISSDTYFSNPTNWHSISLNYKSSEGNQVESVYFHIQNEQIQIGEYFSSLKSRSNFLFYSITIHDFDGGHISIKRSQVPNPESMDIVVLPSGLPNGLFGYILNFHDDSVPISSLVSNDPISEIGQSFIINSSETIKLIQVKARRTNPLDSGSLVMKIYNKMTDALVATSSNNINVSTINDLDSQVLYFNFDINISFGYYYYKISITNGSIDHFIEFQGKTNNVLTGGSLYSSNQWWSDYDMDFNLLTTTGIAPTLASPSYLTSQAFMNPDGSWYVDLTFESVPEAISYKIFRRTEAGSFVQIEGPDYDYDGDYNGSSNYFDEYTDDIGDLVQGNTYYYVVRSVNNTLESVNSVESFVTIE